MNKDNKNGGLAVESHLMNCPFCGGKGRLFGQPKWGVICEPSQMEGGCGAVLGGFLTKDDAVTAWNTRALPPSSAPLLEALEWISAATPENTNSQTVARFRSWTKAVADAALAAAKAQQEKTDA